MFTFFYIMKLTEFNIIIIYIDDIDVCRFSYTHNYMICLSCDGLNDLLIRLCFDRSFSHHRQLKLITLSYLYKSSMNENVLITL